MTSFSADDCLTSTARPHGQLLTTYLSSTPGFHVQVLTTSRAHLDPMLTVGGEPGRTAMPRPDASSLWCDAPSVFFTSSQAEALQGFDNEHPLAEFYFVPNFSHLPAVLQQPGLSTMHAGSCTPIRGVSFSYSIIRSDNGWSTPDRVSYLPPLAGDHSAGPSVLTFTPLNPTKNIVLNLNHFQRYSSRNIAPVAHSISTELFHSLGQVLPVSRKFQRVPMPLPSAEACSQKQVSFVAPCLGAAGLALPRPALGGPLTVESAGPGGGVTTSLASLRSGSSFHVGYYVPPSVQSGDKFGGLEVVWTNHFRLLFSQVRGQWSLTPTESPTEGANMFRDMAKVRFSCQRCQNGWTSMFGVVLFYYKWQASKHRGTVHFMLMGQRCNRCQRHHHFETPMWYPEEAQKVMTNLFYEVCAKVYGLIVPPMIRERRHGRPRHQHDAAQCQGCVLALCKPGHRSDPETPRRIGEKKSSDEEV